MAGPPSAAAVAGAASGWAGGFSSAGSSKRRFTISAEALEQAARFLDFGPEEAPPPAVPAPPPTVPAPRPAPASAKRRCARASSDGAPLCRRGESENLFHAANPPADLHAPRDFAGSSQNVAWARADRLTRPCAPRDSLHRYEDSENRRPNVLPRPATTEGGVSRRGAGCGASAAAAYGGWLPGEFNRQRDGEDASALDDPFALVNSAAVTGDPQLPPPRAGADTPSDFQAGASVRWRRSLGSSSCPHSPTSSFPASSLPSLWAAAVPHAPPTDLMHALERAAPSSREAAAVQLLVERCEQLPEEEKVISASGLPRCEAALAEVSARRPPSPRGASAVGPASPAKQAVGPREPLTAAARPPSLSSYYGALRALGVNNPRPALDPSRVWQDPLRLLAAAAFVVRSSRGRLSALPLREILPVALTLRRLARPREPAPRAAAAVATTAFLAALTLAIAAVARTPPAPPRCEALGRWLLRRCLAPAPSPPDEDASPVFLACLMQLRIACDLTCAVAGDDDGHGTMDLAVHLCADAAGVVAVIEPPQADGLPAGQFERVLAARLRASSKVSPRLVFLVLASCPCELSAGVRAAVERVTGLSAWLVAAAASDVAGRIESVFEARALPLRLGAVRVERAPRLSLSAALRVRRRLQAPVCEAVVVRRLPLAVRAYRAGGSALLPYDEEVLAAQLAGAGADLFFHTEGAVVLASADWAPGGSDAPPERQIRENCALLIVKGLSEKSYGEYFRRAQLVRFTNAVFGRGVRPLPAKRPANGEEGWWSAGASGGCGNGWAVLRVVRVSARTSAFATSPRTPGSGAPLFVQWLYRQSSGAPAADGAARAGSGAAGPADGERRCALAGLARPLKPENNSEIVVKRFSLERASVVPGGAGCATGVSGAGNTAADGAGNAAADGDGHAADAASGASAVSGAAAAAAACGAGAGAALSLFLAARAVFHTGAAPALLQNGFYDVVGRPVAFAAAAPGGCEETLELALADGGRATLRFLVEGVSGAAGADVSRARLCHNCRRDGLPLRVQHVKFAGADAATRELRFRANAARVALSPVRPAKWPGR